MSDDRLNISHDAAVLAGKAALGPGVAVVGVLTLNDWALIAGILCSFVITVQALLTIYWKWRDRQRDRERIAAEAVNYGRYHGDE